MHPRNLHQSRYNLKSLVKGTPELKPYIILNPLNQETIDFSNSKAVKLLNKAILRDYYGVQYWDIPDEFLCPPVPGRADYIHYLADLVNGRKECHVLDIGTGANCIYPLIGHSAYGWTFTASDINAKAIKCAQNIIDQNKLSAFIKIIHQTDPKNIFSNIIGPEDHFDLTMCNPPFHASAQDAQKGSERKWKNLGKKKAGLNFGGQSHELWCEGGEKAFILRMIEESSDFRNNVRWFTSLVSKEENLPALIAKIKKLNCKEVKTIEMSQGQKKSRFIAWSFS